MLAGFRCSFGVGASPVPVHKSLFGICFSVWRGGSAAGRMCAALCLIAAAGRAQLSVQELRGYSLEELMGLEVTSFSRKAEPFSSTAGAVAVITGDEFRRLGARSLPEALRYASGLQVARIDAHNWAVSARGFNASESNKLLVQIDGRTVYTPLFSGVLWDVQDVFLADLDRIEVIRGPGATLWGANAVNGVISITTKDARYTQGGLVMAGGGTEERGFVGVRYGGEAPGRFYYRVYGKALRRDESITARGADGRDDMEMAQAGFRLDSISESAAGAWTLQGDYFDGELGSTGGRSPVAGGNVIGRYRKEAGPDLEWTVQTYYDYVERELFGQYSELRHTYDLDTQVRYDGMPGHEWIAGLGYRWSSDETGNAGTVHFSPASRDLSLASAFIQDEMRWMDGKLGLIVGSKFEHHETVGLEIQPSVRLAVREGRRTLWAAVSRAVRTPSRYDLDLRFPNPQRPFLMGNPDFASESVVAYEAGYRVQPNSQITWDVSLFHNEYRRLRSRERVPGFAGLRVFENNLRATTRGVELSGKWQVFGRWRIHATYAFLDEDFGLKPESRDTTGGAQEYNDPKHTATLRSSLDLPMRFEWDVGVRYVSALPHPYQQGYWSADMRLAWRWRNWEFAVVGQNLLDPSHSEFGSDSPNAHEMQRGVHGSVTWQF